jgi:hypothetical protein
MATTAIHKLTLDPMGKCSNAFFSETTNIIKAKLYMNVRGHLGFPIDMKKHIFCRGHSNDHSWAVWFQLSKWFQRRSVLKHFSHRKCSNAFFSETTNIIKAKLYMNVHWVILYKLYVFCSRMKFKMAATAGLSLTLNPMGKMFLWISDRHKT